MNRQRRELLKAAIAAPFLRLLGKKQVRSDPSGRTPTLRRPQTGEEFTADLLAYWERPESFYFETWLAECGLTEADSRYLRARYPDFDAAWEECLAVQAGRMLQESWEETRNRDKSLSSYAMRRSARA